VFILCWKMRGIIHPLSGATNVSSSLGLEAFPCEGGLMVDEAIALLRTFYERGNPLGIWLNFNRFFNTVSSCASS